MHQRLNKLCLSTWIPLEYLTSFPCFHPRCVCWVSNGNTHLHVVLDHGPMLWNLAAQLAKLATKERINYKPQVQLISWLLWNKSSSGWLVLSTIPTWSSFICFVWRFAILSYGEFSIFPFFFCRLLLTLIFILQIWRDEIGVWFLEKKQHGQILSWTSNRPTHQILFYRRDNVMKNKYRVGHESWWVYVSLSRPRPIAKVDTHYWGYSLYLWDWELIKLKW